MFDVCVVPQEASRRRVSEAAITRARTHTPEVDVATFLLLSSCVNLASYGVAMVTGRIQLAPEAKEES